jgi:hypothetical protein
MPGQEPIHIKESRRGTFTAAATSHHTDPEHFAAQVLAHPEDYSPKMVKKANFVRNIAEK